jgi:hypothetical protein
MANLIPIKNIKISKKINPDSFFGKKIVQNLSTVDKVEGGESTKPKANSLKTEFILIRKKVIKIDKLLNSFIKFQTKNQEGTKRETELNKRSEKESKLEKKKNKVGAISFPSLPVGGNFLESIKRFLFFTFLNIALPKLLELLPKLRELGKIIAPATNFLLDIVGGVGKGLLSGLVNFIDWGYKIRDNTEKTIKQIGGDKAAKDFNEFNKRLNTFIDLSILAGLTALDVGLDAEKFRKKQLKDQQKPKPRKVGVTEGIGGQKPSGGTKVTTGKGGKAGSGTVTQGRGGKPLGKFSKFKSGPFAKFAGPIGKFLGAATPFLGAGIGAADAAARFSSGDKVGGALASASAALDLFSGVAAGTIIGAPLAAIATPISIAIDVVLLLRDLVKVMFPKIPMFANGGKIKLFAEGGRVGTGGRSIQVQSPGRSIKVRSPKTEIKPGRDIGGKQQILKLFPDPSSENKQQTIATSSWWERVFGLKKNQNTSSSGKPPNPYKALKGTAEILNKIPGSIGRLMSSAVMIPLGQKPDRNIGAGFGSFVGKITQDIIDNNVNLSFGDIVKSMSGFAAGGDIRDQNIIKNNNIGYEVGKVVEKAIGSMISSKVNEAVSSIQKEISSIGKPPKGSESPTPPPGGDDPGNIIVSSDQPDFWLLSTAALFENSDPQGAADVAQAIYNRVSMPGDPWHVDGSIRKTILNPGQFQPVKDYGGASTWGKINNKDSAISFVKSKGKTQAQLESVASALLDTTRQRSAKNFVGPRDSFRAVSYEKENNHLADDTEVARAGHVFGFEPRGATIAAFRQGKLKPAEINKVIVSGRVQQHSESNAGYKPRSPGHFNAIQYITGDATYRSNYDYAGHGTPSNYHDHIAFRTVQDKENAKSALHKANIKTGSENDGKHAVGSYHYKNLAVDVPGGQWGGGPNDPITQAHYRGSAKVRQVLGLDSPVAKPQKKSSKLQTPTGKVVRSFKVENSGYTDTYTQREGGIYTENGKPISKDFYDAVLKNQRTDATQASLAPQKPKQVEVASLAPSQNSKSLDFLKFNKLPGNPEGQSGFIAIQPINRTVIQTA